MLDEDVRHAWVERVLGVALAAPEAASDDIDEIPGLDDNDGFTAYLRSRLRQLKTRGQMPIGIAFGKTPADHRVALQANRDPRALATKLRHDTGSTLVTWGIVEPHPERPVTLLLRIEGRQMPALKKRCERMLRTHRPLPYARLALWADGKEVDDIPDPELEAGESRTPIGLLGLPAEAGANSPQARAFADAARRGMPFCEECARKRAAS